MMPLKENLVQAVMRHQAAYMARTPTALGPVTGMRCSCGGFLHEGVREMPAMLQERLERSRPHHKKKRILKKRMRAWVIRCQLLRAISDLALARPFYVCGKCSLREGFYSAIGRNLFPVQAMSDRAGVVFFSPDATTSEGDTK
jgi:hypothetical protein